MDLESLVHFDNQSALERLVKLKGVGRWTAEYVLLRGLGRLDIFPGDDVGARKKLAHFLGKRKPLDYDGVRRAVADWQPYAGFVYFHLLLARIKKAGWLCSDRGPRETVKIHPRVQTETGKPRSHRKRLASVMRHLMNFNEEEKT